MGSPSLSSREATKSTAVSSRGKETHVVKVGAREDPHQFDPHTVVAAPGDVISFEFYPRNHSVVRADYKAPCVPSKDGLFYSGAFDKFNEVDGHLQGGPPTWELTINDTEPIFYYCTAIDSCIKNGMVGAINPNKSMTWETQNEKAKSYPYMLVPGEPMPAEGDLPPSSSSSPSPDAATSHAVLSKGAIAGIAVGAAAFVIILIALFFVLGRLGVYRQWMRSSAVGDDRAERTARWAFFHGGPTTQSAATRSNGKSEPLSSASPMGPHGGAGGAPEYQPVPMGSPEMGHGGWSGHTSMHGMQMPMHPQSPPPHWSWEGSQFGQMQQVQQVQQGVHVVPMREPMELEGNRPGER
ncbi:hypothetical protein P168DRAFT_245119 [Aspergillus campestris IBT 28561]|uniref:Extracellular serine-rich protein n=1 Tax=Aspergillus campestris (strain IBT 28561) TaxID=1392248 RepID=A0A2I1CQT3_ASPC2|nr:uncharacterized protein P168DRAFT_245119 [Aspergillus campestris IBT 28561]PKX99978.1 hypothetical protein P168DRAFT_245119 [Aspergillus campestris IBT 28561]